MTRRETEPVIESIDHFVITVADLEATLAFYESALGLEILRSPGRPAALAFGSQKINVHQADHTFEPKASKPTAGAADFCLVTGRTLDEVAQRLREHGAEVELGPVERSGARGRMTSIYFRDPDGNLIEVSEYS
ncbi:MAG TPA: VOC family protein [Roseiarcus sp.]|jgi:catechol 2,3-dioxygenase-like lactoylglutathione lyase family enzyme|nr:VOC family protein [Roseiarcus sp.]